MTRVNRTRNAPTYTGCGTYKRSSDMCVSWPLVHNYSLENKNECVDSAGLPYVDSNLTVEHYRYDAPRATGKSPCTAFTNGWWIGNIPHLWGLSYYTGYTNARTALSNYEPSGSDAAVVAALTNPSRPAVDLPVFLYELRELPDLLRWAMERSMARRVAGANLAWQFGAAPLIGDLRKLLNFQEETHKRLAELNRLFNGGLRRRVDLGTVDNGGGSYGTPSSLVSYNGGSLAITGSVTWSNETHKWATIDWLPDADPPSPDERVLLAIRSALGLTVDLKTLWEILPWSWMVDWFTSIGSYLAAHRNLVGAHCAPVCVMAHSKVEVSYAVGSKPSYVTMSNTSAKTVFERKKRRVLTPSVGASLPFLSGRQFGILASLAVLRVPRSARYG